MARLASDYYDKHWGPFFESFLLYDSIWQRWFLSGCHTRLCDSLNHHRRTHNQTVSESRECSACKTVIYCSSACQKEDWEAFHRVECPQNRVYRIDRVLDSSWVSHRDRAYLLSLLQHMVLNYEVGMRTSEQLDTPTPNLRFSTVMEYEHAPLQNHHHQGPRRQIQPSSCCTSTPLRAPRHR
ncbi:hypothetical protein FA13DRAFT_480314 [Coprinellus micaceus]|uniref:MYND-type domain-containing protein n=1 Tax=Coprinellus micaceus TaxID=71717 RepID=A0A4Y7TB29_COPMI|nr:hypothetical protein FA13DRAFT_480314 [Coprinellus micaceus]